MHAARLRSLLAATLFFAASSAGAGDYRSGLRGVNVDPDNPWAYPSPETLRGMGFTRVRFVYKAADASSLAGVERYAGAGLSVTLVFNGESVGAPSSDRHGFAAAYLKAVGRAARKLAPFEDKVSYELWNESNLQETYLAPADFGRLATAAARIIRRRHRAAPIILGGLFHGPGTAAYLREAAEAAPSLLDSVDRIGLHVYEDLRAAVGELRRYAVFGKPLSLTEWAQPWLSPADRASRMRGFLQALQGAPAVREAYYFGWSQTQAPGHGYGLTDPLQEAGANGELFSARPELAAVFLPEPGSTWDTLDPDVKLLFQATWGAEAQARWLEEHDRDLEQPGWRGAGFQAIENVSSWARAYRDARH